MSEAYKRSEGEQAVKRTVRKRKKKRPRWQRILRHYWPLIRLVLVLMLVIVLIVSGVRSCAKKNADKKEAERIAAEEAEREREREEAAEKARQEAEDAKYIKKDVALPQAATMAGGYDYLGAIELLKQVKNYQDDPEITGLIETYTAEDSKLVVYSDMSGITHIFFHRLIVDTERAFDGDSREIGYNQYMTTVDEFKAILESMYEKGYVLVSPHQVAGEVVQADGSSRFQYLQIRLPAGKKPFMLSEDDVSYYGEELCGITGMDETPRFATVDGDGFASRLIIGEDGYVTSEYMDAQGNVHIGDYDLVPILEHFCQEHPDFSYHGARGIIAPTGFEGVLGYRTKPSYETALGTERYQQECEQAKAVAQALRDQGWDLGSHSYGHPALGNVDVEKVRSDTEKFHNTCENILGEVDILIYPHGADIAGVEMYTMDNEKFKILWEDGYRYFFNVDNCVAWHQIGEHYFRGNRRDLDGYRMYNYPDSMLDLIDAREILDPARPLPVPKI